MKITGNKRPLNCNSLQAFAMKAQRGKQAHPLALLQNGCAIEMVA